MPKVKKKTKVVGKKNLKVDNNGNYIIEDEADALLALKKAVKVQDDIDEIKRENDLDGKEATYSALRKALSNFQNENDILELTDGTHKSLLVERTDSLWLLTEDDIPQNLDSDIKVKPLVQTLHELFPDDQKYKRMFNRITRRVIDPVALDETVKAGKLSADAIAPSFLSYVKTRYVQIGLKKK